MAIIYLPDWIDKTVRRIAEEELIGAANSKRIK